MLAGVYTSTELYMLTDASDNFADTWAFLDRRLDDVVTLSKYKAEVCIFGTTLIKEPQNSFLGSVKLLLPLLSAILVLLSARLCLRLLPTIMPLRQNPPLNRHNPLLMLRHLHLHLTALSPPLHTMTSLHHRKLEKRFCFSVFHKSQ